MKLQLCILSVACIYVHMVNIFVSLVHYWENFAFMFQLLWEKNQIQTSAPRNSVTDTGAIVQAGHVSPIFWQRGHEGHNTNVYKQCFSVVWVGHGIFGRHRRHLCSDLRIYFTTKFIDFSTSDRMDEMNFRNQKNRIWFTRLGFWHLVGWDREVHSLREYTFHRYHWFVGKHFPVSCAAGNSAVFALSSSSLEIPEFSRPQIR